MNLVVQIIIRVQIFVDVCFIDPFLPFYKSLISCKAGSIRLQKLRSVLSLPSTAVPSG
jgi:hypothetical protein